MWEVFSKIAYFSNILAQLKVKGHLLVQYRRIVDTLGISYSIMLRIGKLLVFEEEEIMKLLTFYDGNETKLGVKMEEGVVDLTAALTVEPETAIPTDIMALIRGGNEAVNLVEQYVDKLKPTGSESYVREESSLTFAPAVTQPSKIICVGLNYKKHADETGLAYPEYPVLFNKFSNALAGHNEAVAVPRTTERLDYEVELGIVIGKEAKYVSEEAALDYVFGYCTTNDLSARDLQKRASQWLTGKSNDGFAPVGPYVVTKDEIEDPNRLRLTTTVNGEMRQDSNTADMIYSVEELVSYISQYMTLEPGDLILTGTPEGVIIGQPIAERVYLKAGDEVTVEVEQLGALTTKFIADK